jgi:iron(III) transport system permease protein
MAAEASARPIPRQTLPAGLTRLASPANLLPALLLLALIVLVAYPMAMIVYGALKEGPPGSPGSLTLSNLTTVLTDPSTFRVFLNTMTIAAPRALLGLAIATTFAWIIARTNTPGRSFLEATLAFMFFLPDLPWVLAWMLLGAPRGGLINQWAGPVLGGDLINVYSAWGLIVLGAVRSAPVLFLFVFPAFMKMDASLEDSARMCGASGWRTILRVDIPLLMPALLGAWIISFVRAMESFEMEQLLGTPAGILVFTTKIYDNLYGGKNLYGPASALSLLLMVLTFGLIVAQWKLLTGKHYTTVSGRAFQARPLDIGPWRWVTFSLIFGFFLVFGIFPFAVLVVQSFSPVPSMVRLDAFTTDHWTEALRRSAVITAIQNTVTMGLLAATIGVALSAMVCYIVTRTRWGGRKVLDLLAWTPWAVPGMVFALGFLWAFVYFPIYGTLGILVLAFIARGLPLGRSFFAPTMMQIGAELEESARIHGASWTRTLVRIWAPLLRPAVIGNWILQFVIAVRVLDTILLLAGPGTRTLSVEIFGWAVGGNQGLAIVLALIQTGVVIVGYAVARMMLGRDSANRAV